MKTAQTLPHYGVKAGYTRNGRLVTITPERKVRRMDDDVEVVVPAVIEPFESISKAKRFMRIGPN